MVFSLLTSLALASQPTAEIGQRGADGKVLPEFRTQNATAHSATPATKFHTFEWPEARIRVKLPEGKREKESFKIFDGYPAHTVKITLPNATEVEVSSIDYPQDLTHAQAQKFVEDWGKQRIQGLGGTYAGGSDWRLGTYGRHVQIRHPSHEVHYSSLVMKDMFYSVLISAPKGQLDPAIQKTVIETFRPWM